MWMNLYTLRKRGVTYLERTYILMLGGLARLFNGRNLVLVLAYEHTRMGKFLACLVPYLDTLCILMNEVAHCYLWN
jgi:hypothetical protein